VIFNSYGVVCVDFRCMIYFRDYRDRSNPFRLTALSCGESVETVLHQECKVSFTPLSTRWRRDCTFLHAVHRVWSGGFAECGGGV
jgi:hypothetical protein